MAKTVVTAGDPITDDQMKAIEDSAPSQDPVRPALQGPDPNKVNTTPTSSDPTTYETDIHLPSKGLVYTDIPETIRIRAMTTEDEKIIFGSNSSNMIQRLLKKCVVYPQNIDVGQLIAPDEQFIMIKLREFTYGSDYHIVAKCPICGEEHEYKVNLSSFECKELPDDFKEPLKMTLPISKHEVEVRMLRSSEYLAIHDIATKRAKKSVRANVRELEYMQRMIRSVVSIDGTDPKDMNIQSFLEKMHARDSAYFWAFINNKFDCGLDTTTVLNCQSCGNPIDIEFAITEEFFRPKFEFD